MTVLSGQTIRHLAIFEPHSEREIHLPSGCSYGLSAAGYDVRIKDDLTLAPGGFALAVTVERFTMPTDVVGVVHDKSTLARLGLSVQNTVIEPGWRGYLTLELANHNPPWRSDWIDAMERMYDMGQRERLEFFLHLRHQRAAWDAEHTIRLTAGQPIAQVLLHRTNAVVERPYAGRYQDQPNVPVAAKFLTGEEKEF